MKERRKEKESRKKERKTGKKKEKEPAIKSWHAHPIIDYFFLNFKKC